MCSLCFENDFLSIVMCSLCFENNFLTIGHIRFRFENSRLAIERVRFASKIICVLSNVFRFKNNLLAIEGVRFASISKKTPFSKLSFAFVSLALPLLVPSFLAGRMIRLLLPPPPPPRQQVVSLSQSSCVSPCELTDLGGRGGRGARSYFWPSINHSILSGSMPL